MKSSDRKIVTRAPSRTVRIINLKGLLPHPVEAESSLEADYVRRAALQPSTNDVIHQPFILPVSPRGYTPDFFQIEESNTPKVIVEIKPEKKVAKYGALFDRAAEYLKPKGYAFYVVTERSLRKSKINERVLLIRRYVKASFPLIERIRVSSLLAEYPNGLPIGTLVRKARVSRELVIHLVARKILTTGAKLHVDHSALVTLRQLSKNNDATAFAGWFGVTPWGFRN